MTALAAKCPAARNEATLIASIVTWATLGRCIGTARGMKVQSGFKPLTFSLRRGWASALVPHGPRARHSRLAKGKHDEYADRVAWALPDHGGGPKGGFNPRARPSSPRPCCRGTPHRRRAPL